MPGIGQVRLTQETQYPFSGSVRIKVEPNVAARFAVDVRIPEWADAAGLRVGEDSFPAIRGTYAHIERDWWPGDTIELDMGLEPRLRHARQQNIQEVARAR